MKKRENDEYSDQEATQRMRDAVRRALNTPHKPHSESLSKRKQKKLIRKVTKKFGL